MLLGSPQIQSTRQVEGKCVYFPGLGNNKSRIRETDSRDPETEIANLEIELRVCRIHDTMEAGLQIICCSLVDPTRGAGGYAYIS